MLAAFDVGVRQFVHNRNSGLAGDHRIDIHLLEGRAFVLQLATRYDFELGSKFGGGLATVGFHYGDYDLFATTGAPNGLAQHGIGLAHSGSVAEKQLEDSLRLRRLRLHPATAQAFSALPVFCVQREILSRSA